MPTQQQPPYVPPWPPPFGAGALSPAPPVTCLDQGVTVTVVSVATGTGTGASYPFTLPPSPSGQARAVVYHCTGTYSVCTTQIQLSEDGGVTWDNLGATIDMNANPSGTLLSAGVPGPVYRLSIATFTGTSVTVNLEVS